MPFIITTRDELMHSAKGSTWKDHKYLKKIGDKYVYATTKTKAANAVGSSMKATKSVDTSFSPSNSVGDSVYYTNANSSGAKALEKAKKKSTKDNNVTYNTGKKVKTVSGTKAGAYAPSGNPKVTVKTTYDGSGAKAPTSTITTPANKVVNAAAEKGKKVKTKSDYAKKSSSQQCGNQRSFQSREDCRGKRYRKEEVYFECEQEKR